ncbi:MAG TPA: hypothetical protein VGM88_19290 [Kofleriaceae bacterium]|jgi:hypothetical protein
MSTTDPKPANDPGEELTAEGRVAWADKVGKLLEAAAAIGVEHGLDVDAYMKGAWAAYVEARPGMRAYLEEVELRQQLDELRKNGKLAAA